MTPREIIFVGVFIELLAALWSAINIHRPPRGWRLHLAFGLIVMGIFFIIIGAGLNA